MVLSKLCTCVCNKAMSLSKLLKVDCCLEVKRLYSLLVKSSVPLLSLAVLSASKLAKPFSVKACSTCPSNCGIVVIVSASVLVFKVSFDRLVEFAYCLKGVSTFFYTFF